MSRQRGNTAGNSYSNGNGSSNMHGVTAGSSAAVIPEQEIRGSHWWHW